MSLTSKKLAGVILAIVAIALIAGVIVCFTTPVGEFFRNVIVKENQVATGDIWDAGHYDIPYTVRLKTNMAEGGTVEFTGDYAGLTSITVKGEQTVTFKATVNSGYEFLGWYNGDTLISEDAEYTAGYTINGKVTIKAMYEMILDGLFDQDDNLVASWNELTDTYGMNMQKSYTYSTYKTDTASPYCVLTNNPELSDGTKMVIPSGVTTIGTGAFYGCASLTSIEIPDGVSSIGQGAFYDCKGLTEIAIPASVTSIGSEAFRGCTSMTSVTFGENSQLTSIGGSAFLGCTELTSVEIPASVTSIGDQAFYGCTGLTRIEIPVGVTKIGQSAFQNCTGLTSIGPAGSGASVEIPAGVTSIGLNAFRGCTSLTSVEIPASVTSIGTGAFNGCSNLTSVTVRSETMVAYRSAMLSGCSALTAIYVPADLVDDYQAADGWSEFASKIQAIQ